MHRTKLLLLLFPFLWMACDDSPPPQRVSKANQQKVESQLQKVNRQLAKLEDENIKSFIKRRGWDMEETGSGVRYLIYKKSGGAKVESGQYVHLDYIVSLLDGKVCYDNAETGERKEVLVEHDRSETGLQEALTYMSIGDKAIVIIPSHKAHGLLGDLDRIPPKSTIVYDITVHDSPAQ